MVASVVQRTWWRSPAVTTVVFALLVLTVFVAVLVFAERNAADRNFVDYPARRGSTPGRGWRVGWALTPGSFDIRSRP